MRRKTQCSFFSTVSDSNSAERFYSKTDNITTTTVATTVATTTITTATTAQQQ